MLGEAFSASELKVTRMFIIKAHSQAYNNRAAQFAEDSKYTSGFHMPSFLMFTITLQVARFLMEMC